MSLFDWLRIFFCFTLVPLARSEKVYLLDTLNATSELGWQVYSNQESGDEWLEETYKSDTQNVNHQAFATCMVEHSNLENWLLLPRLDLGEASRVYFEVKFTMRNCQEIPSAKTTCKETLKLYALPTTNGEQSDFLTTKWHSDKRWELVDSIATNSDDKSQVYVQILSFSTTKDSLYFGIKDEGACSSILYIKVYYEVCPSTTTFLTHFPRTVPGEELNAVKKVTGRCSQNATVPMSNFKNPMSLCKNDGTWQMLTSECECVAGFIPSKATKTCAPCGVSSYKASAGEGECFPCPRNSFSDKLGSTSCECEINFYRPFGTDINAPCVPVETSTNQSSVSSNVVSKSGDNSDHKFGESLQISREVVLVLGTVLVFILICGFMIVVFVHQRSLPKSKHQSDLDVLEHYKQGSMTPDYGANLAANGTFHAFQSDYARKMNVPLIPASYGTARFGMTNHYRPYVDPTTYQDPTEALAEFANEIAPENVEVTRTIGVGEFGEVCSGRLRVENLYGGVVQQIVAVKTLLPGSSIKAKSDFLLEASIMGQFDHPNVVHLVGVVTKSEPVMILTEYMLNGSLDKFLQNNDNGRLCLIQLIQMMCDVASGMKYLCDKGYVHRDLAARNILVDDRLSCKISDFGLSRGVSSSTEHEYTTQGGKIPIRWTSPEAISHRKYTAASDVWSFGILVWEILSFGERPYWEWSNHKVIESVQNGFRLPKPLETPDCLHEIMLQCWQADRHLRPTFDQLCHQLNSIFVHYSNQLEVSNQTCNELNVALPPLTDPPILSLSDFLRLNNLSQCISVLDQNGVNTVDELRRLNCRELVAMGLDEMDSRQIIMQLTRPNKFNYDGLTDSFDSFCAHRNDTINQMFNEQMPQSPGNLQLLASRNVKRSPLLSASSIATNQTAVTSNSNTSMNRGGTGQTRRNTVGEEGFFV